MSHELTSFKLDDDSPSFKKFIRKTNEVYIEATYDTHQRIVVVTAQGDCEHHLIEDLGIFCNKLRAHYGV